MTRSVIDALRPSAREGSGLRPIHGPLTAREWQVIELLAPGHSTDHVADVLVLATETVRSHLKNIMRKLGVHSRADAVAAEQLRNAPPQGPGLETMCALVAPRHSGERVGSWAPVRR